MDDPISRKGAIDATWEEPSYTDPLNVLTEVRDRLKALPSAQPERLTDDDFETIRIHLNAYKEKLCNQHRFAEAEDYQRLIDRFMAFASAQPEQRWIPCSEEPDTDRNVFIARGTDKCMTVCVGHYDHDYKQWYEDRNWFAQCLYDGVYWCEMPPLPGPYREEGEQE